MARDKAKSAAMEEAAIVLAAEDGGIPDDGVLDEGVLVVPEEFEIVGVETVSERGNDRILAGETPITYRMVMEFNPPRKGMKKGPDGTNDIHRIEVFFNDVHVFHFLTSRISRGMPDHTHPDIRRASSPHKVQ